MPYDYKMIDYWTPFNWREERLEIAKELGYQYISESIVETYRKTKSSNKTGMLCGKLSSEAILKFLHKIGEPVESRGGWRPN